jgi:hypothetical protein
MNTCRLCNNRKADKKGSHMVPHFLLKRIENIEGKSGRDFELGFVIEAFDTTSYFGRSVPPEKLEETYGSLTDEEIDQNKHPQIFDNIFCSHCESRLAQIESKYAPSLNTSGTNIYDSGIGAEYAILFWLSVFWRISISKKNGYHLNEDENELLRLLLDDNLNEDCSKIDIKDVRQSINLAGISYKVLRSPDFSITNPTHMVFHPGFKEPYSLLIDEFLLLLSFDGSYRDYLTMDFFGIKLEVTKAPINIDSRNELVLCLEPFKLAELNRRLIDHMKVQRTTLINEFLDQLHISLGGEGSSMPDHMKDEFFAEITAEEKKIGRQYNQEDMKRSAFKVISRYGTNE